MEAKCKEHWLFSYLPKQTSNHKEPDMTRRLLPTGKRNNPTRNFNGCKDISVPNFMQKYF